MYTARVIDRVEEESTARGEAFFQVSGAGHEGSIALLPHLIPEDYLHCHYRDKALLLGRGLTPRDFFDSLYCKDNSHSLGRQMSAHMSSRALNILSIVGPVGNNALQAVGVAAAIQGQKNNPLVVCALGDGTTQQGEFLEAVAEAVRSSLPVLFLVEDNKWAISTPTTRNTFFSHPDGEPSEFYGAPIHRIDGRNLEDAIKGFGDVVSSIRTKQKPEFVILDVDRLTSHTNADDHSLYREESDIKLATETGDPILRTRNALEKMGVELSQIEAIHMEVTDAVQKAADNSIHGSEPLATSTAKANIPAILTESSSENSGTKDGEQIVMRDAIRDVLKNQLETNSAVTLFGEDIDDPKGDVFGVTKGLGNAFPDRVQNSPLTESTIVGASIGRALAGQRPVAFLQFADFLPLAYNQIVSELGSMHWRTNGDWKASVIIMVPCGGYRPGLGPFHAQSFESLIVHTPGVDVFMPSTASDAAGLLNAAFKSERPTVFFYPKSCLNDPVNTTSTNVSDQFIPIGSARKARVGRDITFVCWGNTVRLCERTAQSLESIGIEAEIIDLRCLSPWDQEMVCASAERTKRVIVVHEDNHSCGMGSEIVSTISEATTGIIEMRRVTRPDTFVPCNFANQMEVLPSYKRILEEAASMLKIDISWTPPKEEKAGITAIEAVGSGPSDETVDVIDMFHKVGDTINRGDTVATLEATKSIFDLTATESGVVTEVLASSGDTVAVGSAMLKLKSEQPLRPKPLKSENPGTPVLTRRKNIPEQAAEALTVQRKSFMVGISPVSTIKGGKLVTNDTLLTSYSNGNGSSANTMTSEDIVRRTGIEERHWIKDGESAVGMAVEATKKLFQREGGMRTDELDLVICSTTSPTSITPSLACEVLKGLNNGSSDALVQAYDINAACSGYLYALQAGFDFLQSKPEARVLIITAEVMSPLLDPHDMDTNILFGDAASATLLYGEAHIKSAKARLYRPDLSAKSDEDGSLSVPLPQDGYVQMKGRRVFTEAVRTMVSSLNRVCTQEGIEVDELDYIVPHQANQRIIDAIQERIGSNVYSNIRGNGNTSSTSIPLCLDELMPAMKKGERLGLCAFGGGFTFGAGIVETL